MTAVRNLNMKKKKKRPKQTVQEINMIEQQRFSGKNCFKILTIRNLTLGVFFSLIK